MYRLIALIMVVCPKTTVKGWTVVRNKTTDQGMNELLALVQPFLQDGLHNFPGTAQQPGGFSANYEYFKASLSRNLREWMSSFWRTWCTWGRAQLSRMSSTPKRCRWHTDHLYIFFFDLKDKLRLFFARPNFVPLLTSHARHEPQPERMYGIHGK